MQVVSLYLQKKTDDLISYAHGKLNESPYDHSLIHTEKWSELDGFGHDFLIDILESDGGLCDCEVVLNLSENTDISLSIECEAGDNDNPWKIPINFIQPNQNKIFSNFLISRHSSEDKCYAREGELLVPARSGAKSKKRATFITMRFSVFNNLFPLPISFCDPLSGTLSLSKKCI